MVFEREGAIPIEDPGIEQVVKELGRLKSYGKSSFASLTREDGSYLQVAGGGVGCMLEWKDVPRDTHWRAHLATPKVPFEDGTELCFGGGRIALRRDEWLDIRLVTEAFLAFLANKALPSNILWRDISEVLRG